MKSGKRVILAFKIMHHVYDYRLFFYISRHEKKHYDI